MKLKEDLNNFLLYLLLQFHLIYQQLLILLTHLNYHHFEVHLYCLKLDNLLYYILFHHQQF